MAYHKDKEGKLPKERTKGSGLFFMAYHKDKEGKLPKKRPDPFSRERKNARGK
jgi:hypothetical protein